LLFRGFNAVFIEMWLGLLYKQIIRGRNFCSCWWWYYCLNSIILFMSLPISFLTGDYERRVITCCY